MSHTPAPWVLGFTTQKGTVIDPLDPTDNLGKNIALAFSETDARRIVACVNACEGFTTEELENGVIEELSSAKLVFLSDRSPALFIGTPTGIEDIDAVPEVVEPKLKYASWDELDKQWNFQAYDEDGYLCAYECRPYIDSRTNDWLFSSGTFTALLNDQVDGPIPNWQQTLIERPAEQDGPTEPDPTAYAAQLSAVKTLPELFDFRAKLKAEREEFSKSWYDEGAQANSAHLKAGHELQFFIDRVESQIKSLESNGVFLAAVDGRGAVSGLDFSSGQSTQVEKTTWSVSGAGLSPIEQKANKRGLLKKLRELQSIVKEFQWGYADSEFSVLYDWGLVVKLSICDSSEYAYMWRNDMDYENFFQIKNPPKN